MAAMRPKPNSKDQLEPHYRMARSGELAAIARNPVHVVLDNIRSAFNVGSIFRTADAGAAAHMHLCGMTAYPPNAKLQKTALGAFDYVPWTHYEETGAAVEALRARDVPIIAVEAVADAPRHDVFAWPRPVAIVFGNEVTGVGQETLDGCDGVVRIPMRGHKNSVNVATAFGIVLFEVLRQYEAAEEPGN